MLQAGFGIVNVPTYVPLPPVALKQKLPVLLFWMNTVIVLPAHSVTPVIVIW